jgi:hypothetical protein
MAVVLPRGWLFTAFTSDTGAATARVTVPGIPNVVRVLDSFRVRAVNWSAGAGVFTPQYELVTAAGVQQLGALAIPAATVGADEASFSGLDVASAVGGTLVVTFLSAPGAGQSEEVQVQGHDI